MPSLAYIEKYLDDSVEVSRALKTQKSEIEKIINTLFDAWQNDKPVFIVGNGGSASTATHFTADLIKTVITNSKQKGLRAMALIDNIPLVSAATNDWGWEEVYNGTLNTFWVPGSVVIAFSVHGGSSGDKSGVWSQNLLQALQFAKDNGGIAIGLSGFDGGAMKTLADISVVVGVESTPLVESFHVVLFHLITFRLKEMIKDFYSQQDLK